MLKILGACLFSVLAATALIRAQDAAGPRDTAGGVYSTAQAERGRAAFLENCARCHRADLGGQNARSLKASTTTARTRAA